MREIPLPGLYGFQEETLLSLVLAHMRTKKEGSVDCVTVSPGGISILAALENYCSSQQKVLIICVCNNVPSILLAFLSAPIQLSST